MRTSLILIVVLLSTLNSYSQNYLDGTDIWDYSGSGGYMGFSVSFRDTYKLLGDTNINGYTYYKVFIAGYQSVSFMGKDTTSYYSGYDGPLREENKKIYTNYNGQDTLYLDFNLQVGDTFKFINGEQSKVNFIDSVFLGNVYRKIFNMSSMYNTEIYEGIGYNNRELLDLGFAHPPYGYSLNCFKHDGYSNPIGGNCNDVSSVVLITSKDQIEIIFSVESNYCTLKFNTITPETFQIIIYNSLGQVINSDKQFVNAGTNSINYPLNNVPNGIYFLTVESKDNFVKGKIIVNK